MAYACPLDSCPFCAVKRNRILIEAEQAIAFEDAFPVCAGHTLVIPRKHVASIYDLPLTEQAAVWELVSDVRQRLLASARPDGFNIGVNDGLAAGQTVMHAHIHVIPRRNGDVPDPRGGIRWILPGKAAYWTK
jgi:diadenosine tetraphosphate (Ap4A) HIT family hydrolase